MPAFTVACPVYCPAPPSRPAARIDAARNSRDDRKLWAGADGLAPRAQLTPGVRKTLRDRARYEVQNNSYCRGAVRTLVNDTIGRGPRLQLLSDDDRLNSAVELAWSEWAAAARLGIKLRLMSGVRWVAGECFAAMYDSKRLERLGLPVSLDLRLYEPDQVAHPWARYPEPTGDDGIDVDEEGEPVWYYILRAHPGDLYYARGPMAAADKRPAEDVLHWFEADRPGQLRGVTPLMPALPTFAQVRRFSDATLTAAETAAMLAGVMTQSQGVASEYDPQLGDEADEPVPSLDTIPLVRGTLLTLPPGATATQFKPEQPTATYPDYIKAKLREVGRALNMPYGKIAGDHSDYNLSSGRLDDALYWGDREVERTAFETQILNPLFFRWCEFARFALPGLAAFRGRWWELSRSWQYDARPTPDPVKDATADEINLTNGTDTLADIAAREGMTEDQLLAKRAATIRKCEALGIPPFAWASGAASKPRVGDGQPQAPEAARG